jgi:hypothetical protein
MTKYKIVKVRTEHNCYPCPTTEGRVIKKGNMAVSISGYPRCLFCGLKQLRRDKANFQSYIDEINLVIKKVETDYPKELLVQRMGC